jgi:hypothetical protein
MERESYPEPVHLTGIHSNLEEQAIEFEDRHGTIGRLVFGEETVLYEGQPLLLAPTSDAPTGNASTEAPTHSYPPRMDVAARLSDRSSLPTPRRPWQDVSD